MLVAIRWQRLQMIATEEQIKANPVFYVVRLCSVVDFQRRCRIDELAEVDVHPVHASHVVKVLQVCKLRDGVHVEHAVKV